MRAVEVCMGTARRGLTARSWLEYMCALVSQSTVPSLLY